MTVRASFMTSSVFNKLSFIFSVMAMFCAWISFVMPAWGYDDSTDTANGYGLWTRCGQMEVIPNCNDLTGWNLAWYGTVQSFAVLGFLGVNIGFVLIVIQIFVHKCQGVKEIAFWNFILCMVTGVCYVVAVAVFGIMFDDTFQANTLADETFGYGFGLAIAAAVLNGVVVSILQILEGRGALKS